MDASAFPSAAAAVGIAVLWLALGCASLAESDRLRFVNRWLFPASAAVSLLLGAVAFSALTAGVQTLVLPLGLPELPFHVRIDPLSALFLLVLALCSAAVSVYAVGYFRGEGAARLKLISLQYHCFLASMALVLIADDAYMFMVAWESMALSSYFLVITEHRQAAIRRAGFVYVLIAHVGAIAILLCFGVLQGGAGFDSYRFDVLREAELTPFWASVAFLLALVGFGAKAGMIPLHVWLPEAHPAAPSPVSALMSGVMLKTAIYGLVRVVFDLIGMPLWQWGLAVASIGAATALFGILYAVQQNDLKRLLAYSSVENIGIILIGLGLSMVFFGSGLPEAGALGLIAALFHAFNHSLYKSLLFLAAGSILHGTGLRNLNEMGGLIRRMPQVAGYFLVGSLAISALPPLNGFASEWLMYQTALQAGQLSNGVLRSLVPLIAAMLALAAALTARCFVKAFGIAFLGQPRTHGSAHGEHASEPVVAGMAERLAMAWLVSWCFALGLFPAAGLRLLNDVAVSITGAGLPASALDAGVLWLVPSTQAQASYGPLVFLLVVALVVCLTYFAVRWCFHGRIRRAPPWDCGFPEQTPRMQDTSDGFGQSIRQIFEPIFRISRRIPQPDDPHPRFELRVEDKHWHGLYLPLARCVEHLSAKVGRLQQGRIGVYLLYSFVTLIALLVFVR